MMMIIRETMILEDHLADFFVVNVKVSLPHPQKNVVHTLSDCNVVIIMMGMLMKILYTLCGIAMLMMLMLTLHLQ